MNYVWLTERSEGHWRPDVLGIVSDPDKGRKACQDDASEYFGAGRTPPLKWTGSDGYDSASYYQPGTGSNIFYQVTRFTVDEIITDRR